MAETGSNELVLKKSENVKCLPVEDTVWFIEEELRSKNEDGLCYRELTVTDKNNCVLGTTYSNTLETTFLSQCFELLYSCMMHPVKGLPRKPQKVTFKDLACAEKAAGLDLSDLGIVYMFAGVEQSQTRSVKLRECSVCHLSGSEELFKTCSKCNAVLYCSVACQERDLVQEGPLAAHSHKHWCEKMKLYMEQADKLRDFPFTFTKETTSDELDGVKYRQFLQKMGVLLEGAWRRECQLSKHIHSQCLCLIPYGELPEVEDDVVLPVESSILDDKPLGPPDGVCCWQSYYKWRGFRMDSPVAILLHWPLTVFYIVKHCLPNDYPHWQSSLECCDLSIHIVGVEKEVEILPIFKELGYMLPNFSISIHMYGNNISKKVDGKIYEKNNIRLEVVRGVYHRKCSTAGRPHLVIGFNAGLGVHQLWSQTLVKLRDEKTPAYFTDYCQYSSEYAQSHLEALGFGSTSEPIINPFRKPVRKLAAETNLPWYSNGFIYHLVHPT